MTSFADGDNLTVTGYAIAVMSGRCAVIPVEITNNETAPKLVFEDITGVDAAGVTDATLTVKPYRTSGWTASVTATGCVSAASISSDNKTITYSVSANENTTEATGTIKVTYSKGSESVEYVINVTQEAIVSGPITYQHVFNAKPKVDNNISLTDVSWNITAENLGNYNSSSYAGVQIGTSKANGRLTLTTPSSWSYKGKNTIKEIRLWLNLGGTSVTPTVTIGGKSANSDGTAVVKNSSAGNDWTKTTKVTFSPATDGNTGVVVINVETVKAGYICAIEIDCE